jgi:hypothetical protein
LAAGFFLIAVFVVFFVVFVLVAVAYPRATLMEAYFAGDG